MHLNRPTVAAEHQPRMMAVFSAPPRPCLLVLLWGAARSLRKGLWDAQCDFLGMLAARATRRRFWTLWLRFCRVDNGGHGGLHPTSSVKAHLKKKHNKVNIRSSAKWWWLVFTINFIATIFSKCLHPIFLLWRARLYGFSNLSCTFNSI